MSIIETINEEFGSFGISVSKDTLAKGAQLCSEYRVSAEDLVYGWVAYSSERGRPNPTDTLLEKMAKAKLTGKQKPDPPTAASTVKVYNKEVDPMIVAGALEAGTSPITTSQGGKRQATPTQVTPKRGPGLPSRAALFSPTSYSPKVTTPSERYETRTGRGEVTARFGPDPGSWVAEDRAPPDPRPLGTLDKPYRYMFERLNYRTDVLNDHILEMGERLQRRWELEDYAQPHMTAQEPVLAAGRVSCDGPGRLNSKSIMLEGGKGSYGEGRHVELDVSQLHDVGLFTGQIVAVKGVNPMGQKFVASSIYTSAPPPSAAPFTLQHGFTLMTACGPFTNSEDLLYTPLVDLLDEAAKLRPQILLLMGPFVDSKVIENELAETYHQLWERLLALVRDKLASCAHTRVLLMPSVADLIAEPVLPTPPIAAAGAPFTMLPNPCMVDIGGVVIGATSTDVLMHISQQEVKLPGAGSSDRLARLSGYLLDQCCFYPLYPSDESVGLDFQHWKRHCHIDTRPHLLLLPSDFKGFVKEVSGCVVVNPSRLARGQVGGTYATVRVPPATDGKFTQEFSAQVVKV